VSNKLKARLIKALVWPIVTYGSEAWTLNKELCENVEAFEIQCYRRAMCISYVEHVMNEEVLRRVGQDRGLLRQVKSRKLKYFGHTTRHESLQKDIMLGIMAGKLRQGGQKKQWIDDIVQWGEKSLVEMVRQAENKKGYRCLVHEAAYARTSGTASWWDCSHSEKSFSFCDRKSDAGLRIYAVHFLRARFMVVKVRAGPG